ncbi:MAG TPA: hypothetical protein DCL66_14865 [Gammaproteobacteria bacterium]|nr:hypothetical protein [Gammaproteobacteria bacterium]
MIITNSSNTSIIRSKIQVFFDFLGDHSRYKIAYTAIALSCLSFPAISQQESSQTQEVSVSTLEEIIVTANRKEQNIQDVAGSLQAIDGDTMDQLGQVNFESYINTISSAGFTMAGNGAIKIGMRGVSNITGGSAGVTDSVSTVAVYLNDIPIQGNGPLPDLALYDLSRVEALKGPQGTLYGEGAMGGAIKMVLNPADSSGFEANVSTEASTTENGGAGYQVRSMVNIPISKDKVALRLVADYRDSSGFIDNISTGQSDVNSSDVLSLRGILNADITDKLSAELLYLHQELTLDGFSDYNPDLGDLESNLLEDRYNEVDFDLFGLTLKYSFDRANLVSSTSYWANDRNYFDRSGFTGFIANFTLEPLGLPTISVTDPQGFTINAEQNSFTQEFRLSSVGDERVDWSVGAFYRNREQKALGNDTLPTFQTINDAILADSDFYGFICSLVELTLDQCLFDSATDFFTADITERYEQLAFFGEFDYGLTENLDLTIGLRWFEEDVDVTSIQEAKALIAADFIFLDIPRKTETELKISEDGIAPRLGLSYRLSDNKMVYGLASKGFRSGGPNFESGRIPGIPESFASDELWNYELGFRGTWHGGRLVTNATLFYLDWEDIQLNATRNNSSYKANGGDASITGLEFEIAATPSDRMKIGVNLGFMDSELKSLTPDTAGLAIGSSLPNAPDFTASANFDYILSNGLYDSQMVFHIDYRYVGSQAVQAIDETAADGALVADAYSLGNAQFGFQADSWSAHLFVQNITDERAVLNRLYEGFLQPGVERRTVVRPRTFGIRLTKHF